MRLNETGERQRDFRIQYAVVGFLLPGAYGMVTPGPSSSADGSTPSTNFSFDPIPPSGRGGLLCQFKCDGVCKLRLRLGVRDVRIGKGAIQFLAEFRERLL